MYIFTFVNNRICYVELFYNFCLMQTSLFIDMMLQNEFALRSSCMSAFVSPISSLIFNLG